jgi:P4 family phage/plasmid primase-like protien
MLSNQIISELESYGLKKEGSNKYRCKSNPFRPESDSNSFTIKIFDHERVGWMDHVSGQKGGTQELCEVLNIPYDRPQRKQAEDTKKSYTSMDEYARAHGVLEDVLKAAGWHQSVVWDGYGEERKERPVLIYPTATGDRYRFIDGESPHYKSQQGYKRCWYGLKNVIESNDTLVLCNGEISTVVAQHFGIPAFCFTGGEKPTIPDDLMPELRLKAKDKQIIIALDCDDTGRNAAQGIRQQLQKEGFNVIAKDMQLTKGGDLADHCKLYGSDAMADLLACPDMLDDDELDDDSTNPLRPSKPTDDELGDRVIEKWNGKYAYFYGQWYEYLNGVWVAIQSVKLDIWNELKLAKAEGIRPSDSKVSSIEKYIQLMLMVDDDKIDNRLDIINLQNGVFNLETETLEPHQEEQYMTSQLPFAYDPDAKANVLHQFMKSAFVDSEGTDWELVNLVQEAIGYSLTSNTDHRVSFWLVGESGTGKSVLINLLATLAGSSYVTIDLDQLSQSPYQLADIAGKRVVTFTEPSARSVLADNHYKRLVSQDEILARQIFGKPFRFTPICKVWGAMNDTPRVLDRSDAVFNRVIIINMNNRIPDNKRDPRLLDKLKAELPGIFNWALAGLKRLRSQGHFTQAEQSVKAREEYKAENDTEGAFAEDCLEFDPNYKVSGQALYDAYNTWCKRNGCFAKANNKVSKDWVRLGLTKTKISKTFYLGARLIPNQDYSG